MLSSGGAIHEIYGLKYGSVPEDDNSHVVNELQRIADELGGVSSASGPKLVPAVGMSRTQQNPGATTVNDAGRVVNFNGDGQNTANPLLQDTAQRKNQPARGRYAGNGPGTSAQGKTFAPQQQQPPTLWVFDRNHNLQNIPLPKYQAHSGDYSVALPVYSKGDANGNGSYGMYVTPDEFKEFMGKNYETTRDFYQPGRRAVDANGREIIVPFNGAEQAAKTQGATLLPLSMYEVGLLPQIEKYRAQYNQAGQEKQSQELRDDLPDAKLTKVDSVPQFGPDEVYRAQVMVPYAKDTDIERYLPSVIDGLKWKFRDSWQQFLPYALATISVETPDFIPKTQGNSTSNSLELGRGWVQLSEDPHYKENRKGPEKYKHMTDALGLKADEDLVTHPWLANRPDIAGKILAQYIFDRRDDYRGRPQNAEVLQPLFHWGEKDANGQPVLPPDAQKAFSLYLKWRQNPTNQNLRDLGNNELVRARVAVNGHHIQGILPNGLHGFLPAMVFDQKQTESMKQLLNPNTTWTLQDAVDQWTQGLENVGDKDYAATVRKGLGLPTGTNLSAIRIADLPESALRKLMQTQKQYARSVQDTFMPKHKKTK